MIALHEIQQNTSKPCPCASQWHIIQWTTGHTDPIISVPALGTQGVMAAQWMQAIIIRGWNMLGSAVRIILRVRTYTPKLASNIEQIFSNI